MTSRYNKQCRPRPWRFSKPLLWVSTVCTDSRYVAMIVYDLWLSLLVFLLIVFASCELSLTVVFDPFLPGDYRPRCIWGLAGGWGTLTSGSRQACDPCVKWSTAPASPITTVAASYSRPRRRLLAGIMWYPAWFLRGRGGVPSLCDVDLCNFVTLYTWFFPFKKAVLPFYKVLNMYIYILNDTLWYYWRYCLCKCYKRFYLVRK